MFSAKSAALEAKAILFASLPDIGFDPLSGIESVQKLQANFGGEGPGRTGAGTPRQILNKLLASAEESPEKAGKNSSCRERFGHRIFGDRRSGRGIAGHHGRSFPCFQIS